MSLRTEIEEILQLEDHLLTLNYNLNIEELAAVVNPANHTYRLELAEKVYEANRNIKAIIEKIEITTSNIDSKKKKLRNNIGDLINKPLAFEERATYNSAPQKFFYLVACDEDGFIEVTKKLSL